MLRPGVLVLALLLAGCLGGGYQEEDMIGGLTVTSPAFEEGQTIPQRFGCTRYGGEDVSPELRVEGVPESARSLAFIFDDPDAPRGRWTHWVFWDLDPGVTTIAEGADAAALGATVGTNSWGRTDHGGPCPPDREHRYYFRFYALDAELGLGPETTSEQLRTAIEGHVLADGRLMGRYAPQ